MRAFWLALQFLTRLPTPVVACVEPLDLGRSVLYYPLVGLILGALLYLASQVNLPPMLSAALTLSLWLYLSGALHIDGLADMADAWVGGHGDRERTLEIMKDPNSGPMGVTAIVLLLLFKFVALLELLQGGALVLLVVPLIGRSSALALMLTTPYVREHGLASDMVRYLPRQIAWVLLILLAIALLLWLQWTALGMLFVAMVLFVFFRQLLLSRLGGFTGDSAGALIEMVELAMLLAAVALGA